MAKVIGITKHENWHVVIKTYNNVTFVVKLLIAEKAFEETLGHGSGDNVESTNIDLFRKKTTVLARGIPLQNYICRARGNWIQAGAQAAEDNGEMEQDLFDENLEDLIKRVSIDDNDDE